MSQADSFVGRLSTTIGLLLKDPYLGERAIQILNTVMKVHSRDTSFRDNRALICLYITYALKTKVTLDQIIRILLSFKPVIKNNRLDFSKCDRLNIGSQLKKIITSGTVPLPNDRDDLY